MKWLSTKKAKFIFLVPTLVIYIIFMIVPIFIAVYYSFTEYTGLGNAAFTGLDNYISMFHDRLFIIAMKDTMIVLICSFLILLAGSFLIALLLDINFKGNAFVKSVIFSPYVIAPIIIGVIWGYILNPNFGLLNSFLRSVGLDGLAIEWIGGRRWSPVSIAIVFGWQVLGFHATIFLAGMKTIPTDIYEASAIDGVNGLQKILLITIPMLKETIIINIVLIITGVFKIYELVYQLTGGGPSHLSEVLVSYMYFTVFTSRRYGYGMAIAVIILIISVTASFSYIRISSRKNRKEKA
ncbi:sugar ABC transporter permease [Lachnospiraceae bacterium ZAX-1]